jgi:hypothetical protein
MWKQIFFRGIVARSLFGVILSMACPVNANAGSPASGGPLIYATDRAVYKQGDVVKIGVTNTSDVRMAASNEEARHSSAQAGA